MYDEEETSVEIATEMHSSDINVVNFEKLIHTSLRRNETNFNYTGLELGKFYGIKIAVVNSLCEGPKAVEAYFPTLPDQIATPTVVKHDDIPPSLSIEFLTPGGTDQNTVYRFFLQKLNSTYSLGSPTDHALVPIDSAEIALHYDNLTLVDNINKDQHNRGVRMRFDLDNTTVGIYGNTFGANSIGSTDLTHFLEPAYQYQVKIRAETAFGVGPSYSNFSTSQDGHGFTLTTPDNVKNLTRNMLTMPVPTQIRLAWNKTQYFGGDDEEHVQYLIYGDTVDGHQNQLLHVANYTEMTWDHNGLTPGSVWFYTLKVRNRAHTYSVGTQIELRALGCPASSTSLPALLSAYTDAIYLTWAKGNLFTEDQKGYDYDEKIRYRLYHNSSLLTNYSIVPIWTSPDHNTTSFNHTGLEQKNFYGYYVSIENSVCESTMSQ
jgi:hypothetical protein